MDVLVNHCFCTDSNWGGSYNCRTMLVIEQYKEEDSASEDEQTQDWTDLIEEHDFFNKRKYEQMTIKDRHSEELMQEFSTESTNRLKPEVLKWLNDNIKDRDDENKKGWCVGSDSYNANMGISFAIFFHRQTDAMKFIKTWSVHKNPLTWFNYFDNIRKKLDIKTNKLKIVKKTQNDE